jgi:hypothetical protein
MWIATGSNHIRVIILLLATVMFPPQDYRLIVERFACPSDPESYADGTVSTW